MPGSLSRLRRASGSRAAEGCRIGLLFDAKSQQSKGPFTRRSRSWIDHHVSRPHRPSLSGFDRSRRGSVGTAPPPALFRPARGHPREPPAARRPAAVHPLAGLRPRRLAQHRARRLRAAPGRRLYPGPGRCRLVRQPAAARGGAAGAQGRAPPGRRQPEPVIAAGRLGPRPGAHRPAPAGKPANGLRAGPARAGPLSIRGLGKAARQDLAQPAQAPADRQRARRLRPAARGAGRLSGCGPRRALQARADLRRLRRPAGARSGGPRAARSGRCGLGRGAGLSRPDRRAAGLGCGHRAGAGGRRRASWSMRAGASHLRHGWPASRPRISFPWASP